MYTNTTAEFRPELQVKVEEAMAVDKKFIAELLFPIYGVQTRKGYYKKVKRGKGQLLAKPGNATANDPLKRAPGTAYRRVTRTTDQGEWMCVDRGLEEPMDDVQKQEESRFFDMEASTAKWLMRNTRISREERVAAVAFSEAVWGPAQETSNAYTLANIDTFDFASDLKTGLRTIEKRQEDVNTLVISKNMWDLVTSSGKLRSYFFGANGGNAMITMQMVAEKFELEQILIGRGSYDTTKPGKDSSDDNLVWTWGDDYFGLYNVQGGAPENGGAGRSFVLEELTGGQLFVTETYREEATRSDILRVRQDEDVNTVNENCGLLVKIND